MVDLCIAYDYAAVVARVDTMTGQSREEHHRADQLCAEVEQRGLQLP